MRKNTSFPCEKEVSWSLQSTTVKTVLLVLFLLCLPLASAFELKDVRLTYDGEDVQYLAAGGRVAQLRFTITDYGATDSFDVDYSSLFPAAPADYATERTISLTDPQTCVLTNEGAVCSIRDLIIKTDQEQVSVNFTAEQDGAIQSRTHDFSFKVDTTSPTLVSIQPQICDGDECEPTCYEGQCYVNDGYAHISLEFEDAEATFDRKHVAFTYGSTTNTVYDCEGLSCWGLARFSCNDGQTVRASIAVGPWGRSSDDAGNPIKGDLTAAFTCDATAPRFSLDDQNFSLSLSSGFDATHPVKSGYWARIGDEVTLTLNVTEKQSPLLRLGLVSSSLGINDSIAGSCALEDQAKGRWQCTATFPVDVNGPVEGADVTLTVSDLAANDRSATFQLNVLGVSDGAPNYWTLPESLKSMQANRYFLQYARKEFYFPLSLKERFSDTYLLDVKGAEAPCTPTKDAQGEDQGTAADLTFDIAGFDQGTVWVRGVLAMNEYYEKQKLSKVEYTCPLSLLSIRGDTVAQDYEDENFTISFKLYESPTMGDEVQKEINDTLNRTQNRIKALAAVRNTVNWGAKICGALNIYPQVTSAFGGVQAALSPYPPTKKAADTMGEAANKFSYLGDSQIAKYAGQICGVLSCEASLTKKALKDSSLETSLNDFSTKVYGKQDFLSTLNPYDSFLSAVTLQCAPAILYHIDQLQGMNCEYAACLSKGVPDGSETIESCQTNRNYARCMYWGGGVVNFPLSMLKNMAGQLLDTFEDPVSFVTTAGLTSSCIILQKSGESDPTGALGVAAGLCKLNRGLTAVSELGGVLRSINQQAQQWQAGDMTQCDQVRSQIDSATAYWNYYQNPVTQANAQSDALGPDGRINANGVECNQFTYCSKEYVMPVGDAKYGFKITSLDVGEKEPKMFVQGISSGVQSPIKQYTAQDHQTIDSELYNDFNKKRTAYYQNLQEYLKNDDKASLVEWIKNNRGDGVYGDKIKENAAGLDLLSTPDEIADAILRLVRQDTDSKVGDDPLTQGDYKQTIQEMQAMTFLNDLIKDRIQSQISGVGYTASDYKQDSQYQQLDSSLSQQSNELQQVSHYSSVDTYGDDGITLSVGSEDEAQAYVDYLNNKLGIDLPDYKIEPVYSTSVQAAPDAYSITRKNDLVSGGILPNDPFMKAVQKAEAAIDNRQNQLSEQVKDTRSQLDARKADLEQQNAAKDKNQQEDLQRLTTLQDGVATVSEKDLEKVLDLYAKKAALGQPGDFYIDPESDLGKTIIYDKNGNKISLADYFKTDEGRQRLKLLQSTASSVKQSSAVYFDRISQMYGQNAEYATMMQAIESYQTYYLDNYEDENELRAQSKNADNFVKSTRNIGKLNTKVDDYSEDFKKLVGSFMGKDSAFEVGSDGSLQLREPYKTEYILGIDPTLEILAPGFDSISVMFGCTGVSDCVISPENLQSSYRLKKAGIKVPDGYDDLVDRKGAYKSAKDSIDSARASLTSVLNNMNDEDFKDIQGVKIDEVKLSDMASDGFSDEEVKKIIDYISNGENNEQLKKLRDGLDDYARQQNQAANAINKELRRLSSNVMLQKYLTEEWGANQGVLRQGAIMRTASAVNSVTNLLEEDLDLDLGWGKGADKWFARARQNVDTGIEESFCKATLGKKNTDAIFVNQVSRNAYSSAAHIEGVRVSNSLDGGNYTYFFHVFVQNAISDENLTFSVLLKQEGGSSHAMEDYDHLVVEPHSTFANLKDAILEYNSTSKYDTICLRFNNDHLERFFAAARSGSKQLCRRLEVG